MNAPWYAVYIQTPLRENLERDIGCRDAARHVTNTLDARSSNFRRRLALTFKGADVVSTIASFVEEYGITHIIMGRTQRPWYRRWFGQSLLDRLLRARVRTRLM